MEIDKIIAETGGMIMSKLERLIQELCPNGVDYVKLGDCSRITRGERVTKGQLTKDGTYPVISGGVSPMGFIDKYNRCRDTITVSQYGTAGYVDYQKKDFWANDICYSVYPNDRLVNKYLWYIMKNKQEYLYQIRNTDAIPYSLPIESLKSIEIPIPPLPVQEEIVRILDAFTDYTAELQADLQADLQARREQYEYYRNKLLSFPKSI